MGNTKMKKVWERRVVEIDDVRSRKTRLRLHFNGGSRRRRHTPQRYISNRCRPPAWEEECYRSDDRDDTNCARVRTRGRSSRCRQTRNIDSRNPGQSGGFLLPDWSRRKRWRYLSANGPDIAPSKLEMTMVDHRRSIAARLDLYAQRGRGLHIVG